MSTLSVVEHAYQLKNSIDDYLYPPLEPYQVQTLPVSSIHSLWYAQYGNPNGVPVLAVHGGPGGSCGPNDMRFFDPAFFRIILLDQRGAGRSEPIGETRENTTSHLIEDMEKLRKHLGVEKWVLFGGSWGSALSLAYGEAHPKHCLGFILRGIFLGTKTEYEKLWYGMGDMYPEAFDEYVQFIPENERHDLIAAYHKRLFDSNADVQMQAALSFCKYDFLCATLFDKSMVNTRLNSKRSVLGIGKLFAHYSINKFFFTDDQLIKNLSTISHLPAIIVHGRYDVICRASSAYRLHKSWPGSSLTIVQDAGHAASDLGMIKALVDACHDIKNRCC